jgi:1-acyl-sn-glycerol-3-phosphate acyltransferase
VIVPPLSPAAPRWGNPVSRGFGRAAMRLLGWRMTGMVPDVPKLVAIAAPHTCSLDVVLGIIVLLALGARVNWLAKHTTFRGPQAILLRWVGAISVNRAAPASLVRDVIERMRREDRIFLALAPEGTRRKVDRWKSGFYRIALAAGVPILPVALDYSRRIVEIGTPFMPTGDYEADLPCLQSFFRPEMARHPERF